MSQLVDSENHLTSFVAVFALETGLSETVLEVQQHLEAPNWMPDGKALLVNGGGCLFRLMLSNGSLHKIDTGFADKLNNDHGISPDGSLLVISDSSQTGGSCIYTLPIEGGDPQRVTWETPSYWHGWSPDGATLTYTARRQQGFQIYTCPSTPSASSTKWAETQITSGFDHCDGPDYTPDGCWIWFNGEIQGSVQLWRVRPDGSDLQQMSDDERVNWFPHPSPDGRHVVYLAYENGTKGHPANRCVELRMMPAEGGSPQILTGFQGGQGSINVPSWSPDSRRFAYVFYATQ